MGNTIPWVADDQFVKSSTFLKHHHFKDLCKYTRAVFRATEMESMDYLGKRRNYCGKQNKIKQTKTA